MNSVSVVVLGYFSVDDQRKCDHFCFGEGEDRSNFLEGSQEDVLKYIIAHFSQPSSVVLDLTELDGKQYCTCWLLYQH
jgi:hypothetical protein